MELPQGQARISSFLSVAVITCASHAQGRRFEPGRKHPYFASSTTKASLADDAKYECFLPGSNRRPCACEAHVITATLRKPYSAGVQTAYPLAGHKKNIIPSGGRTQDLWIRSPTRYPLR